MSAYIKIDNQKILRQAAGMHRLDEVGLYEVLSAFLGNPKFDTCCGGLVPALRKHCKNGYFSFHRAWSSLCEAGYLKRIQIPIGLQNHFQTYYELLPVPDGRIAALRNLTMVQGRDYLQNRPRFALPADNYTAVSYAMIMDPALSLAAKGLYALVRRALNLASHCDHFTVSKKQLNSLCSEGRTAFNSAWAELRRTGYLEVRPQYNHAARRLEYSYLLREECTGFCPDARTTPPTQGSAYRPQPLPAKKPAPVMPAGIASFEATELQVRQQINAAWLEAKGINTPMLRGIVDVMTETYLCTTPTISIGKQAYAAQAVQDRLRRLELSDVLQIMELLKNYMKHSRKKIRSPRKYILSCLFHGGTNVNLEAAQMIAKDFD